MIGKTSYASNNYKIMIENYDSLKKASAEPMAASMIETFRAVGYSPETAVADILDNSISAGAKNIWINREWAGDKSTLSILDDGVGMNDSEIIEALRPGSTNPLAERSLHDLGRFGMGLKTASFSQCRKLTVVSKKEGHEPVYWRWDLDYVAKVNKWEILNYAPKEALDIIQNMSHGTLVLWEDLDRIVTPGTIANNLPAHEKFSDTMERVRKHIAMTFHRFIEDHDVKIFWCEHEIEPWNPFCPKESKRQEFSTDFLYNGVTVKGYVLPHRNNFSSEEAYKKAEGINGWAAQQGFYIYRNKRLLLGGDWLGLFRKEEHLKLVRIAINLSNTEDAAWQIDIKKSTAYPPNAYKPLLEAYAKKIRSVGNEVFRHRGRILKHKAGKEFEPLWNEKRKDGKWSFAINRNNSLIKELTIQAKTDPKGSISTLLHLIEESVPVKAIYISESQNSDSQKEPYNEITSEMILPIMKKIYERHIESGLSEKQAKELIKSIEPFNNFEDLIQEL